jgi:uncharacterized protein
MVQRLTTAMTFVIIWVVCVATAGAQDTTALRGRTSSDTVGILSMGEDSISIRIIRDLAAVLDSEKLRILPVVGNGSLQNIANLVTLREIDIGIVQSDVLAYIQRGQLFPDEPFFPGVEESIRYIIKLYTEEVHVLASRDIARLTDLAGKKVNFDVRGSGTSITASLLFDKLHVKVDPVFLDPPLALEKVRSGELAALVLVTGKPARLFFDVNQEDGVHFLPVPLTPELLNIYQPARLGIENYPLLIGSGEAGWGQSIDTVAVSVMLAVYNWAPKTDRYRKLSRFVDAFFRRLPAFQGPPRHPKWKEVDLAAPVPGWLRFAPAETWPQGR